MSQKIHKVLASVGLDSRRNIEQWIKMGRVLVDDRPAHIGQRVSVHSTIKVDGRLISLPNQDNKPRTKILAYNKPLGELCTRADPEGRPTVFANLPPINNQRWILVGRLDINTSGLLLITNDGILAHRLMHPASQLEREYLVRIHGKVTAATLQRLTTGVQLADGMANFSRVTVKSNFKSNSWLQVVLKEGRNREVRRLWESQSCQVNRLTRIRFANVTLDKKLKPGCWRALSCSEQQKLLALAVHEINS